MNDPWQFCIRCFQRFPNDPELQNSPCCGTNLVTLNCSRCHAPVEGTGRCAECGLNQTAPSCPRCGHPVTETPANTVTQPWLSSVAWNTVWHGERPLCRSCGYEFTTRLEIAAGHPNWSPARPAEQEEPQSEVEIRPNVSCAWSGLDLQDWRPVIEIHIRRKTEGSNLAKEAQITFTPEEWQAVMMELQGDLRILSRQKPWWVDTT